MLAEVFLDFRKLIFGWAKLDPCRYIGIPSLAYDVYLKLSGVKIGLMPEKNMLHLVEESIRGGLSFAATRHIVASDNKKILDIDANNLYESLVALSSPFNFFF